MLTISHIARLPRGAVSTVMLSLCCLMSGAVFAQSPRIEPATEGAESDERVEVHLVEIPILARGRGGKPVDDLRAEELRVKHGGRAMRVAFLEGFDTRTVKSAGSVKLYVAAPGGRSPTSSVETGRTRNILLLVDVENDDRLERDRALADAVRFVEERIEPTDRTAVFAYDGEIHLELDFSGDREAVRAAVLRAFDRPPRVGIDLQARVRGLIRRFEDCVTSSRSVTQPGSESCINAVAIEYADELRPAAEEFLDGLETVIEYAAGLRAHTTVIAISHGVATDLTPEVMEAARAVFGNTDQVSALALELGPAEGARLRMDAVMESALAGDVTFHFVDRTRPPAGHVSARQGGAYQPGAQPMEVAFAAPQQDLEEIAARTGGLFVASTDLFDGLSRAIDLIRGGYLLGYYLDHVPSPDQLRSVRISTSRKGVRILHKRASIALTRDPATVGGELVIGEPLRLEPDGGTGEFIPFRIVADPKVVGYEIAGDEAVATFTLHVTVEGDQGRLADSYHLIQHSYPAEVWGAGFAEPMELHGWAELPPGNFRLVAYLRNPATDFQAEWLREVDVSPAPE